MDDVIQDMRQEKLINMWNKFKTPIIAVIAFLFSFTAIYSIYGYFNQSRQEKLAEKLISAQRFIASNNYEQALTAIQEIDPGANSYGMLSSFLKASIQLVTSDNYNEDKVKEAIGIYGQISEQKKTPPHLKELAQYLRVNLEVILIDKNNDWTNGDNILKLIESLDALIGENKAWNALALDLKGYVLYKSGNLKMALEIFTQLATKDALIDVMAIRAQFMSKIIQQELS